VVKPPAMHPLGRQDNIKIDLIEIGCDGRKWTELPSDNVQ
jgi:hypothetical protein